MQAFQRDLEKFTSLNTQILGISSDSLETHRRFAEEYDIQFPLVADTNGDVRRLYDRGRVTYLIDRQGVIRFIQKGVPENSLFLEKSRLLDLTPVRGEGGS